MAERLAGLPDWQRRDRAIVRTWTFRDFDEALAFVNQVAVPAQAQDHHPDVHIHWNTVTLELWTHAAGGLTERDFRLALAIGDLPGV